MKITIWIRNDAQGDPTLRTDYKLENADTPTVQRFGMKLLDAIEGAGEKPAKEAK